MARYLLTLATFPVEKTPIREIETSWLRDPNWKNPCFSMSSAIPQSLDPSVFQCARPSTARDSSDAPSLTEVVSCGFTYGLGTCCSMNRGLVASGGRPTVRLWRAMAAALYQYLRLCSRASFLWSSVGLGVVGSSPRIYARLISQARLAYQHTDFGLTKSKFGGFK
jgi:hypothetical protein